MKHSAINVCPVLIQNKSYTYIIAKQEVKIQGKKVATMKTECVRTAKTV